MLGIIIEHFSMVVYKNDFVSSSWFLWCYSFSSFQSLYN